MEAGFGCQGSPSGVPLLLLPQHCIESRTPGLLSLVLCCELGRTVGQGRHCLCPHGALSGREEKKLSSHSVMDITRQKLDFIFVFCLLLLLFLACLVGSYFSDQGSNPGPWQ